MKKQKNMLVAAALCASLGFAASANAALITFEESIAPTPMANAPGTPVLAASRLSNQYQSLGVVFSSGAGYAAVVNHHPTPQNTPSFPATIAGTTAGGLLSYNTAISATFYDAGNAALRASTGFVRVLGDRLPLGSGTVTMNAFGFDGALLGAVTAQDVGAAGTGPVLSLTLAGIHRVTFNGSSGTVVFDNFEFGALTTEVVGPAPVPEPASLGLLALALGGLGFAARRTRRS